MKKRTTKKYPRLNDEQLDAVRDYAIARGPTWRRDLIANWKDGQYPRDVNPEVLEQVRDQFGPDWITAYTFPSYIEID
jgi:hypothetical protein